MTLKFPQSIQIMDFDNDITLCVVYYSFFFYHDKMHNQSNLKKEGVLVSQFEGTGPHGGKVMAAGP